MSCIPAGLKQESVSSRMTSVVLAVEDVTLLLRLEATFEYVGIEHTILLITVAKTFRLWGTS